MTGNPDTGRYWTFELKLTAALPFATDTPPEETSVQIDEVGEFKEALHYRAANLALQQGWRVMAVVPRGAITVCVLGKGKRLAFTSCGPVHFTTSSIKTDNARARGPSRKTYFFFLSGVLVSAEPATDFSLEEDFLSFSCSLAFDATPLLVFSLLAMLSLPVGVPVVARCLI